MNRSSCRRFELLLQSYVDGEITRGERERVETHVVECQGCAQELESLRHLSGLLRSGPVRVVSPGFEESLAAAVRERSPQPSGAAWWERFRLHFDWKLRVPAMVTAGSLAVTLVAGIVALRVQDEVQERQAFVANAERRHLQLEQASESRTSWDAMQASIELNTGSIITE
jgi:anti-sigma factor RsiW